MAVVHFVNRPRSQNKAGMLFVLRYCMLDKKTIDTDGRKYVTGINCTPQSAYTEFLSTKRLHQKDDGRQYYHFVQSFPIGEDVTPSLAHEIALRFATEAEMFKGYEITVSTHCDRRHVHSHFVMNSVNMESGKKFHINTNDIENLMKISDSIIAEYGLLVLQPKQKSERVKGIGNGEMHTLQKGQSWKLELAITIDQCMKQAKSKKHFIWLMEQEGYKVKWTDERKNITYTCPNGKKCCDDKLHETKYLKESMEHEFRIRNQIVCGLQEGSYATEQDCGEGYSYGNHSREQLESDYRTQPNDDRLAELDIESARGTRQEGRDDRSSATADQFDEAGERQSPRLDQDNGERDARGYAEDGETGWEPEREELFFSAECQDGNDSFYEEALRDFDSGKLDCIIGGAYLAADIQNLIDDDGEIIDCTTRHYGERRDKKKQGMSMGGM